MTCDRSAMETWMMCGHPFWVSVCVNSTASDIDIHARPGVPMQMYRGHPASPSAGLACVGVGTTLVFLAFLFGPTRCVTGPHPRSVFMSLSVWCLHSLCF